MINNEKNSSSLLRHLSSKEWAEIFLGLSNSINFEFAFYSEDGNEIFITHDPPFCKLIRSTQQEGVECPGSCIKMMFSSVQSDNPVSYKCIAGVINFVFEVDFFEEKAFIVGRGGFASYEDLLSYLDMVREKHLPEIPVSKPIKFHEREYVDSIARYVQITVKRLLSSHMEKSRLEEKLMRIATIFDSQTFGSLSKNPELMYRYILDTVDFILGTNSAAFMLFDEANMIYKAVYSTGKYREEVANLSFNTENSVVSELINSKVTVFSDDLQQVVSSESLSSVDSAYFFPIFIGGVLDGIIVIFDKRFSAEDMKIMNAFKDYVQLNLENRRLRLTINQNDRARERLSSFLDFSDIITSITEKEKILNALLNKSLQLVNAEQGSLMILDPETSELVVEAKKSVDDTVHEKMRLKVNEGIAGQILESGSSVLVEDIEQDPRFRQTNRPRYKTKSFISVPIRIHENITGIINISDKIKGQSFDEDDLNLVQSIMKNASVAVERSFLFRHTEELQKLSITDPLTNIYNRRYLNRRLTEEITRYNRFRHPFSFMMLDLDKFKDYNDTYGHIPGDTLLRNLAGLLEKSLRTIDIAARFGGDEFVVIFPQTSKVDAIQITNRLKEKIDAALREYEKNVPLGVSMGLATFPDDATSIMELIEKTDQALYLAKKAGGNRVVYL
jgi:diguanylate cyclase (GGDEF)-like protein